MAESTRLTLATIPFDLQIAICIFLRPIDILALRKTCKAFEISTRKRVVWVAALHRVCLDNTLFLPSFPIPDMSDLELEQAAIAPHRWIELFGAFKNQDPRDPGTMLRPRTTRIIRDAGRRYMPYIFLVPGGRYLVVAAFEGLFVWDLGYVSSAYCTLIASGGVGLGHGLRTDSCCMVQTTPDGMGLIIVVFNRYQFRDRFISVYEIYPQSETPLLTQIAHLDFNGGDIRPCHLLPDTLIFRDYEFHEEDRIVFRVWDYRVNYSTCFSADVKRFADDFVTKTAIIVLCGEEILVWAIPPLLPHSADLFLDNNPTCLPPLFRIPLDGIVYHQTSRWKTISSWYFDSWESIYIDIFRWDSFNRFKLIVKPDLSDASLRVINTSVITPHSFRSSNQPYKICEDTLVSFWGSSSLKYGIFTGLTSSCFTGDFAFMRSMARDDQSLCPASGRSVYYSYGDNDSEDGSIVVVDFLNVD